MFHAIYLIYIHKSIFIDFKLKALASLAADVSDCILFYLAAFSAVLELLAPPSPSFSSIRWRNSV